MIGGRKRIGEVRATAQEILKLLAKRPGGMTIIEITSRLRCPAEEAVQVIATLQSQRLLSTGGRESAGS